MGDFTYFLCQTQMEPLPQVLHRSRASFETRASRILQPLSIYIESNTSLYVPLYLKFASQEKKHYRHLSSKPHQVQVQSVSCSATDMQNLTNLTNQIPSLADFT